VRTVCQLYNNAYIPYAFLNISKFLHTVRRFLFSQTKSPRVPACKSEVMISYKSFMIYVLNINDSFVD
jgi:hypothetical protein